MFTHGANLHEGNTGMQKLWQRKLLWLEHRVRRLDSESNTKPMPLCGSQRQLPNGIQIQSPSLLLHIAPIAANVEHIHKRKTCDLLNVIFQCLSPFAYGNRGPALLPRIPNQPEARITQ